MEPLPAWLASLPIEVAERPLRRLRGLALRSEAAAPQGLLIPRCRSVHTFGMRFELDLVFLDAGWRVVRVAERVRRRRLVFERRAAAVLELKGGTFRALGVDEEAIPVTDFEQGSPRHV